ncbi:receptor-like serine/threonine-protein kinase SD1-8 [Neltuma alba]|uniref:receptor-like serine/threonine-protein kinase SD1-8 n=1 Tax=Neltuma alba TaxID=207710 RepID=UPI0010A56957|nr:receptor-like serine/threonine-protein kinase SD1-8 [Prosopis alba]
MGGFTNLLFFLFWFFFITFLSFFPAISFSSDTLNSTQSLKTNCTLLSAKQTFVLGFFSLDESRYYLGIWYKNISDLTVVWVANRDNPLEDSNGFLKIGNKGNMEIVDRTGKPIWSSNQTISAKNPVLQILDSGNLVIRESSASASNSLWHSFDYPTDTLLPGMKLLYNFDTKIERHITSWSSKEDPSTGVISFKLDFHGLPEIFLWKNKTKLYRSGPWNGVRFSGVPEMKSGTDTIEFDFYEDEHQVYYTFKIGSHPLYSRLTVTPDGELQRLTWVPDNQVWTQFWIAPKDQCDNYKECGPYGICDTNASPVCTCTRGFSPKNIQAWNLRDGSDGCVRDTKLDCGTDKFLKVQNVKLPDTTSVFVNKSMNLVECAGLCQKNCSCTAYANIYITNGGSGCVMWSDELIDMRVYTAGGQDLYVRLAASDVESAGGSKNNVESKAIGITVAIAVVLAGLLIYFLWKRRELQRMLKGRSESGGGFERSQDSLKNESVFTSTRGNSGEDEMDELELPLFDFNTISMATNNFSEENKLGEGGFGSVYRGRLMEGQEIAVKRLSRNSGQGTEQFKNEVRLIARLQHRNLVRLFGCCVEMDEKMLVYEYMENRSLDSILFDKARRSILNWQKRFYIICGIARGLLYLHQDSRFRIIHRDLKASNVLLDEQMNPKISDFGMARIFGTNQTEANTLRVVGTYGYMSPEYAMDGLFSIKSDVFSFGVLVLEIITGRKNRGFYYSNDELNLLGHAWSQWKEGKALELIDPSIADSYSPSEVLRCVQVGLLCVQERAEDRPTMATVVLMLSSETVLMPQPKSPGFCVGRNPNETETSSSKQDQSYSVNEVTVTMLHAR